jgi:hypothetical protein
MRLRRVGARRLCGSVRSGCWSVQCGFAGSVQDDFAVGARWLLVGAMRLRRVSARGPNADSPYGQCGTFGGAREKPSAEVLAPIAAEILGQIVRDGPLTAAEIENSTRRFKKALIERALGAELTHHLGFPSGASKPELATDHRNGTRGKTVLTHDGPVAIEVPRDRRQLRAAPIGARERRFTGFDDKVIAPSARGITVREIQAFLKETYAVEVSPDLISAVTDAVVAEVAAWQSRPLEPMYPMVFLRCLARQDSRRSPRPEQSRLSDAGRAPRRHTRHPRSSRRPGPASSHRLGAACSHRPGAASSRLPRYNQPTL